MNILVSIDFSNATERQLRVARNIAGRSPVHIYLLHVADPEPDFMGYDTVRLNEDKAADDLAIQEYRRWGARLDRLLSTF